MRRIGLVLRIITGVGLLSFLFYKTDIHALSDAVLRTTSNLPWVILGIALTFLGLLGGAVRWGRILAFQGFKFSTLKAAHICFVGQFFNAFMLGSCGGDLVRAFYAGKDQRGKRTSAAMTVVMDRSIGLITTIVFSCFMILVRIHVFLDNQGPRGTGILMVIFMIGTVLGLFVLFRKNVFEHFKFFQRIENTTRIGALIRQAYEVTFLYKRDRRVLLPAVMLSLLSLVLMTLSCWCFGQAIGLKVPIIDFFALFPIITVLMSVPITPGSLGVREGLFVTMFGAVGVDSPNAILMSLMVYAGGVFWSLFGGLLYVGFSSKPDRHMPAEFESLQKQQSVAD